MHFFFSARCSPAAEFFSRTFGCGTSRRAFGTLRRMSRSRPSSVALPGEVNVAELALFSKGLRSASLTQVGVDGITHNLLFFFNTWLRCQILLPPPIFCLLYNIGSILFTPSAVCYDAATYTQQQQQQQQQQQLSRAYVYVAPNPVTYVVHLALNMSRNSPAANYLPPPAHLGARHLATISRVMLPAPHLGG